jgi:hypothetical protein
MNNIETLRQITICVSTFCAVLMLAAVIIGIATNKRTKNARPVVLRSNFPVL